MAQFEKGNRAAEKWTLSEATDAFEWMMNNAMDDSDVLCVQDAYLAYPMRGSVFHYLIDKFPVLEKFKRDIQDVIISRINRNALRNEFNPTASIWRQKQLGEKDTQYQKVEATVDNVTKLTPEQRAKRIEELKAKLNND
jgi:hypothetical protein